MIEIRNAKKKGEVFCRVPSRNHRKLLSSETFKTFQAAVKNVHAVERVLGLPKGHIKIIDKRKKKK